MAEGHREAAHSVLDGGEHNATLGASGIARLIGSGPLENGHAVLRQDDGSDHEQRHPAEHRDVGADHRAKPI